MSFLPNCAEKGDALSSPSSPSTAITSLAPVRKLLSAPTRLRPRLRSRTDSILHAAPPNPHWINFMRELRLFLL